MHYESARIETEFPPISAAAAYARCFDCRSCNQIFNLDFLRSLEEEDYRPEERICPEIDKPNPPTDWASLGIFSMKDLAYHMDMWREN